MTPRTQIEFLDLDDSEEETRRRIRDSAVFALPGDAGRHPPACRHRPGQGPARRLAGRRAVRPAAGAAPAAVPAEHRHRAARPRNVQEQRRADGDGGRRIRRPRRAGEPDRHPRGAGRRHRRDRRHRPARRPARRRHLADRRHARARRAEAAAGCRPTARRRPGIPHPRRLSDGPAQPGAEGRRQGHRRRLPVRDRRHGRPARRPRADRSGKGQSAAG